MAGVSRHLPRCLAQARFAKFKSASNLQRRTSGFSRTGEVENSSAYVGNRGEFRRDGAFEFNRFYAIGINPPKQRKVFDLRYDTSRSTVLEPRSESFGSPSESQDLVLHRAEFFVDHNFRRISPRSYYYAPSTFNVRSVWTAVSAEDKLRSDDEELDLKTGEDNLERTIGKKQNGHVVEDAKTSMYASSEGPSQLTTADVNKFLKLSPQDREQYFGESLPPGLLKEFDETKESAFLIRTRVLELLKRFQKYLADIVRLEELKDQGESGKSASLAMLVHWARVQGWLVFYVPNGSEWTSVGMYFKNTQTGLFDTPIQAKTALEGFLKSHAKLLGELPCRVLKPLPLGEGAGMGIARGPQQITFPEGATLRDLLERGVAQSQAAVSCVVRLREELNLVQDVPVLVAIDEFNAWFTFSSYHESTGTRFRRPIHASELSMVNAFRTMEGPMMMATAFSQSLAVGKLPVHLPGVPKGVKLRIPRYSLEETRAVLKYYDSRKITQKEPTEEDIKKLFFLTNGNGEELRNLVRLL